MLAKSQLFTVVARRLPWIIAAVVFLSIQTGCQVRLISEYDENIDKGVTAVQKDTEHYFENVLVAIGKDPKGAPYADYAKFFTDERAELSVLIVRAQATPLNTITVEQLTNFQDQFAILDTMHQNHERARATTPAGKELLTAQALGQSRDSLQSSVRAILKLEIAKRRGTEKQSGK